MKSDLTLAEFPGRHFPGDWCVPRAIDPGTRTLLTEVDVDNSFGQLLPGAYAEVHLTIPEGPRSLILPVSTLIFRSEGLRVGVVRDGKAQLVPIIMGKDYGNEVEVVSGLNENDAVISNPPDSLSSGAAVQVVNSYRRPMSAPAGGARLQQTSFPLDEVRKLIGYESSYSIQNRGQERALRFVVQAKRH